MLLSVVSWLAYFAALFAGVRFAFECGRRAGRRVGVDAGYAAARQSLVENIQRLIDRGEIFWSTTGTAKSPMRTGSAEKRGTETP